VLSTCHPSSLSHLSSTLLLSFFFSIIRPPPRPPLFPYTTLFRSFFHPPDGSPAAPKVPAGAPRDRASDPSPCHRGTPACLRETRSEEHTSELQSLTNLVCRLLLEKKKTTTRQCLNY